MNWLCLLFTDQFLMYKLYNYSLFLTFCKTINFKTMQYFVMLCLIGNWEKLIVSTFSCYDLLPTTYIIATYWSLNFYKYVLHIYIFFLFILGLYRQQFSVLTSGSVLREHSWKWSGTIHCAGDWTRLTACKSIALPSVLWSWW